MGGPGMMSDDYDDIGPVQVGYAIVTPSNGSGGLAAFATFGMTRTLGSGMMGSSETMQAGMLPAQMTTNATLFVSILSAFHRELGLAMVNPSSSNAVLTLTLRDSAGAVLGSRNVNLTARQQTSVFIGDLFSARSNPLDDVTGTLSVSSSIPVALAPLRFRGLVFSMIPLWTASASSPVPQRDTGVGGPGALIFPHFAQGGGWSVEIVLANSSASAMNVRVDFYGQDGNPLKVRMNNDSRSSFTNIAIPAGGVTVLAPKEANGYSRF